VANSIHNDPFEPANHPACEACESLLTDALDDLLGPADQAWFDAHIASCEHCSQLLADAQRGAAWLQMLKAPRPEPSSHLLERIFAETSDTADSLLQSANPFLPAGAVVSIPSPSEMPVQPWRAPVVPFRPRTSTSPRWLPTFNNPAFEPRLAMTAAMAFFSIALTLNLTGVRLDAIHVAELSPSTLKRSFYEAKGDAARRYDSLRVLHVLESRVDDLKAAGVDINLTTGSDQPDGGHQSPRRTAPALRNDNPPQPQHPPREHPQAPAHHPVSHLAEPDATPLLVPVQHPLQPVEMSQQKWGRA
jgi:hypothetical protein